MIDPMFFWSAHDLAPINCASGCASNHALGIHASLRAQHRGVALWPGAAVEQIEMDYDARLAELSDEQQKIVDELEEECRRLEADCATMKARIDDLEAKADALVP